jgi:hypothetical protein
VAIIVAIKAETFLTRDVLWDVFVLDAAISAPIALVCSLIPVYFAHGAEG